MQKLSLIAVMLLCGCSNPKQPPTSVQTQSPPTSSAATPLSRPAVLPLSTEDILHCDRRSVLYDQSKHKKEPEPPKVRARNMQPGDTGYISFLTSKGGKIYVADSMEVKSAAEEGSTTMIRRVTDGFLADCDSPELLVWLDEGADYHASIDDLIPVIGHIDVKPRRKMAFTESTPDPATSTGIITAVPLEQ